MSRSLSGDRYLLLVKVPLLRFKKQTNNSLLPLYVLPVNRTDYQFVSLQLLIKSEMLMCCFLIATEVFTAEVLKVEVLMGSIPATVRSRRCWAVTLDLNLFKLIQKQPV